MSSPFPTYSEVPTDGNSFHPSLLTPPLTPLQAHDVPWRPSSADRASLNMKKKHHRHNKWDIVDEQLAKEENVQDSDLSQSELLRNKSMSYARYRASISVSPTSIDPQGANYIRRWTLPSKSEATRGLTPLRSTVKQTTVSDSSESPAMITLRRATTRRSPKTTELTFFPEATFSHEKNGLLSYLVSTFSLTSAEDERTNHLLPSPRKISKPTSVDNDAAHPTMTYPAATVRTELAVDASLSMPGTEQQSQPLRRCSTKYISVSTTYEIIWDENDSTTTGDQSRSSTVDHRRPSLAVAKLEAQLVRSSPSTRRAPEEVLSAPERASRSSSDMFQEQVLSHSKVEHLFARLQHKTGLRDLPRSRGSQRGRSSTLCSITVDNSAQQTLPANSDRKASMFTMDFFPPLASRRASIAATQPLSEMLQPNGSQFKGKAPAQNALRPHPGSLLGSSSHSRRKSSANISPASRRGSNIVQSIVSRLNSLALESWLSEADTEPLLDNQVEQANSDR
ncbi:hypothetical protein LTS08_005458 [Lithohypha guttulata]|uniref:uncharacterized protein n=1 Tax=Lithohypha guttulata TaxID=1690604 RepID=UPI002DDFEC04|nr:hypothetical protein LTR51_003363 [Lithohypha guttulata]KAK5099743.1 hypothetical protein LTS08_005458 [Lithohypha guttulata]